MRRFLRNTKTGAFFRTATRWTPDQNEAHDFEEIDMALRVARELRLQNVELVDVLDDGTELMATRLNSDF